MKDTISKYNLTDFTEEHYVKMLRLAKHKFTFRSYTDFKKNERFIIWRHDIDAAMEHAARLAEIEANEKIKAVYFVLLHSEMYNLLEKRESGFVEQIIKLGHVIGLHFDPGYYDIQTEKELVKYLTIEKEFLEKLFHVKIKSFAFHNPTPGSLRFDKFKYAGMVNTYAKYFREKTGYCSDSNGHWRNSRLEDVIKSNENKQLQILTHPLHWQKSSGYPKHKVWRSIMDRCDTTLKWYDGLLLEFERENIQEHKKIFDYLKDLENKSGFNIEKNWIAGEFRTAYRQAWRLHHKLVNSFLKLYLEIELHHSKRQAAYFYKNSLKFDLYKRFELVTGLNFLKTFRLKYNDYKKLVMIHEDITSALDSYSTASVKKGFISLVTFLIKLETIIRN